MTFKYSLSKKTGIEENILPSSYQIIGDIFLVKLLKIKSDIQKKKIASAVKDMMPRVKTICEIIEVSGELRQPRIKKLLGRSTITIEKEHGIFYKMDVSKIMFSKGNKFERQRLLSHIKPQETVIDMFAGIGYFSLSIAKKCKELIAIEKNPTAFRYLKENITLNNLKNIKPILGDSRFIFLNEKADRILMGYFPNTEKFLPSALKILKNNGIIHFHNSYHKNLLWNKPISDLKKHLKNFRILNKRKVKTVGPNMYHVVLDVEVNK
jgi:tRNA wybutosine-synthesizing protein 2